MLKERSLHPNEKQTSYPIARGVQISQCQAVTRVQLPNPISDLQAEGPGLAEYPKGRLSFNGHPYDHTPHRRQAHKKAALQFTHHDTWLKLDRNEAYATKRRRADCRRKACERAACKR